MAPQIAQLAWSIRTTTAAQLLPLENGEESFLPSTMYALGRELICEQVAAGHCQ